MIVVESDVVVIVVVDEYLGSLQSVYGKQSDVMVCVEAVTVVHDVYVMVLAEGVTVAMIVEQVEVVSTGEQAVLVVTYGVGSATA